MKNYTPVYMRISESIRQKINNGMIKDGERFPPEPELAEEYEVSRMTLRRALDILETEGFLTRRKGRGTFAVRKHHRTFIAVLVHAREKIREESHPYHIIIERIQRHLEKAGDRIEVLTPPPGISDRTKVVRAALEKCRSFEPDGIFAVGIMDNDYINQLKDLGFPLMVVDFIPLCHTDCIALDSFGCGSIATRHLVGMGHRNIAFFGARRKEFLTGKALPEADSIGMSAGYRYTLERNNISFDEKRVVEAFFDVEEDIREKSVRILDLSPRPTAAVVFTSKHAAVLLHSAREKGMSVPENLSIVCLDNRQSSLNGLTMTVVRVDLEKMADISAQRMMDVIKGTDGDMLQMRINGTLIEGTSCRDIVV